MCGFNNGKLVRSKWEAKASVVLAVATADEITINILQPAEY